MYKCGWNGCEKAYGTLNHLNAHVTMQSHGQKRTPEGMFFCTLLEFSPSRPLYDGVGNPRSIHSFARNESRFFVAEFVYTFI